MEVVYSSNPTKQICLRLQYSAPTSSPSDLPGNSSPNLGELVELKWVASVCVWSQHSQARILPISGVNPWSLPGVVVDEKHSAIVIPGFLPARGQRQLRALSTLTGADPRHSVGMVRGLEPSALLFIPPKKSLFTALQQTRPRRTWRRKDLGRKYKTFHRGCPSKTLHQGYIHNSSRYPRQKNTTAALSRSSVLHVRLLHHISFLRVHIRVEPICINGRTYDWANSSVQ